MLKSLLAFLLIGLSASFAFAQKAATIPVPTLTPQTSGTTQLLIAVSPVSENVVWAAGTGGTFVVTTDGGNTWKSGVVPSANSLQFRDVQGVSDKVAYLMAIGNDAPSFRIYKTEDGGATWEPQATGTNETLWSVHTAADGRYVWAVGDNGAIIRSAPAR